jgi:peptidyl-prolyl cis-trans isomerase SurA
VIEHQPEGQMSEKDADNQIQERIYYEKLQPAVREYLTQLREESYVDIKAGYVDTGASAKQTKPVIAEVTDQSGDQQKKKKKKLGIF